MLQEIIKQCESGKFEKAMELILQTIDDGVEDSEVYRIKGQIEFDKGEIDPAINSLIESLRLDDKNQSALVLIGNIYAAKKNDLETAMNYFNKVLEMNTDNYVALNNIGGLIAKAEDFETAKKYFNKTLEIKPDYVYTHYGLALVNFRQNEYKEAFESCLKTLNLSVDNRLDREIAYVHEQSENLILEISKAYASNTDLNKIWTDLKDKLEVRSGKQIKVVEDPSISTPAKLEVAEYRDRKEHHLIIREGSITSSYFIMHELMHLQLICDARDEKVNELFISNKDNKDAFKTRFSKYNQIIRQAGITKENQVGLEDQLFNGLLLQAYNAPLDLVIEQLLFENYPTIRPVQLLGLLGIAQSAIDGAQNQELKKIVPPFIRNANIVMSMTLLIQIKELYHIDLLAEMKEPNLVKKGKQLYEDFIEVRNDKSPGEEYDVIRWWAEELKLTKYFKLEKE